MPLDQIDIDTYDPNETDKMGFLDHLEVLRWHIIRSLGAIMVGAIGLFVWKSLLSSFLFGPKRETFLSYKFICWVSNKLGFGDKLCFQPIEFNVQALQFAEEFLTHLKVSFIGGFVIAFPYIFWEFWRFLRPALHIKEQKAARGIVFYCSVLFLMGASFGYFIIAPFGMNFLAGYSLDEVDNSVRIVSLSSYVNYLVMFVVPVGLIFELPVLVYILSKMGLITPEFMKAYRKHAFVAIIIMAAIITPPDVITQFLIAVPLYFIYELSILICKRNVEADT